MKVINVAKNFSKYPAGRFIADGPYSGEKFREEILLPLLQNNEEASIEMDGARGYGSSFLEEAFGGLRRKGYSADEILKIITINSSDDFLKQEILNYINDNS